MIYLDHAATTPVHQDALQAAWPWLTSEYGNPSSHHELGYRAAKALEDARIRVATSLNCRTSEITFTSGGTESDNLGIIGLALANPRGKHIVTSPTEHNAVLQAVDFLERMHGFTVTYLPVAKDGSIQFSDLVAALRTNTTLVSLMMVNNEVGTVHPIAQWVESVHAVGAMFHTDAVQAVGWLPIDIAQLGIDALSISGHKFGAPKGSGVLFTRGRFEIEPVIHGGGQEYGRRSGTENVAWAVALAQALDVAQVQSRDTEKVRRMQTEFIDAVLALSPRIILTGSQESRTPAIASFVVSGLSGESLLVDLEERGIVCSSGSACAAGSEKPSHVLTAMGYPPDVALAAVRFSFSHSTTEVELAQTVSMFEQILF